MCGRLSRIQGEVGMCKRSAVSQFQSMGLKRMTEIRVHGGEVDCVAVRFNVHARKRTPHTDQWTG